VPQNSTLHRIIEHSDVLLAIGVVGVLVVLVIPVPPVVIDVLLTLNISVSLLLLLVALGAGASLEFSTFPSLLLFTTLFRLALNVASTRQILLHGYAGQVIFAFGNFVVGGNIIVGMVIFLILVVIQFVVITKGSGRISEVAARFTLDAMPGKQMAIDADLNSGLITEQDARERRDLITREAEFYGAMDGASKFVRGDAVAGLIITAINLGGGMILGKIRGMTVPEAAHTYSILTVGDGLVSQIPSLIIATTAGVIVTKASSRDNLARDVAGQILTQPRCLAIASGILAFFGLVPGLPKMPFFALSAAFGGLYLATRADAAEKKAYEAEPAAAQPGEQPETEELAELLHVDRMAVEVGYQLIPLVDPKQTDVVLRKIGAVRRQMARQLGLIVPPVHVKDNLQLGANDYVIKIRGQTVTRGELMSDQLLAMDAGAVTQPIEGTATREPAFGLPALWVPKGRKPEAEAAGYTVADPASVLITHLSEVIKSRAFEILSREDVRSLVDAVKERNPTVVDELIPNILPLGVVQRVLQNLLRERVPISDLPTILEALSDHGDQMKDPQLLTEHVRRALARTICCQVSQRGIKVGAIALDPALERSIAESLQQTPQGMAPVLEPTLLPRLVTAVSEAVRDTVGAGYDAILVTSSTLRRHVRAILEHVMPDLPVLSYDELVPDMAIEGRGTVSIADRTTGAA